jgi:hypothetical protein
MQQRATGLAIEAPAAAPGGTAPAVPSSGGPPHYRNDLIEAWVRSASGSIRAFTAAVEVRNRRQEDLLIAYQCDSGRFTDDHGNSEALYEIGGLSFACRGDESNASSYTTLGAGSATTFVLESTTVGRDPGTLLSLSFNLWRLVGDKPHLMSMGFSNIPLSKAPESH